MQASEFMDAATLRNLTAYTDVNEFLCDWVEEAQEVLGAKVLGLYLFGSLTYEDFAPGRSDIDLQAVITVALTQEELSEVERLHDRLEKSHAKWQGRVECSYLPAGCLPEILPPSLPRPWWGFGRLWREAPYGNEWIINRHLLYRDGIALEGPAFRSLVGPVGLDDVRRASARDLLKEWEPKIGDTEWLTNSHYQSYLILNLCRILYTVIGGRIGSKTEAAAWVRTEYPEWDDLVGEAERWEHGETMKRQPDAIALIRFAVDEVERAGILG